MIERHDRQYDITVFGATSFVGQLVVDHLLDRHGTGTDGLRWAVAGRNRAKLEQLLEDRGVELPVVVADAADREALNEMVTDTQVVVSTVGPYALYGSELVAAVVAAGADYCDLSGESQWLQAMVDAHQEQAMETGSRIVPSCGFDSIPSDLGVWFTQGRAHDRFGRYCSRIAMRVKGARGGFSGGTVASGLNTFDELAKDPSLRKVLGNPYALAPAGERYGVRQSNVMVPGNDNLTGSWVAPFIMGPVNSKVVHRTHALLGRPWGDQFRYDEAIMTGTGPMGLVKASAIAAGMGGLVAVSSVGPIRRQLQQRVLPKPGTGPDEKARESGFFDLRFFGQTDDGRAITTKVTGDRDPGYGSTAKMLGETAAAFLDPDAVNTSGSAPMAGFLTPAAAFGDALIDRLVDHAGLSFSVLD
jgi:short subunit dehydrogenase-like uncharacterized protein